MTLYRYRARGVQGTELHGQVEASSAGAAAAQISASGAVPIDIADASEGGAASPALSLSSFLGKKGVTLEELVIFSRQLRALVRAGVPLIRALNGLGETSRNPRLAEVLAQVADSLQSGRDLAQAMGAHPDVFSNLYVNTVHMGESSGRLEQSFEDLAAYLERENELIKRIKTAARYPTMVVGAVAVAIGVINVFVIPSFADVFADMGARLPLPTRILMGLSAFTVNYWPLLLGATVGALFGWRKWVATERGRYLWHAYRMRIPAVGPVIHRATLARFARGFSMASRAGLPIIQTLEKVARSVDNAYVEERVGTIAERISRGATLSSAANASGLFTPLVMQMIAVGEESGSLTELLEEAAEYYEREVEHDLDRLSDAIEPLLIIGLGIMVLILALGVYLPLWDMASVAKGP